MHSSPISVHPLKKLCGPITNTNTTQQQQQRHDNHNNSNNNNKKNVTLHDPNLPLTHQLGVPASFLAFFFSSSAHYGDLGYSTADFALVQSVEAIELTEDEKQDDLTFKRLCMSIEQMIFEAKSALDQCSKPAGVKVLSLHDMCKCAPWVLLHFVAFILRFDLCPVHRLMFTFDIFCMLIDEKEVREAQQVDEEDEDDADNVNGREMSQMTFVQDDDDGIIIKDHVNVMAKYSIEVLAPQDDDEPSDRASDIAKNQHQRRRQSSKETRRDSGLSRSSGESMRAQNRRQQGDGLFRDDSDDEGDHENDSGGLGLTSSPHIMISSAVLETPTIVT